MIDKLEMLLNEQSLKDEQLKTGMASADKSLEQLEGYIMDKARNYLNGKTGGISSETVLGWAIHYYTEPNEVLFKDKPVKPIEKKVVVKENPTKVVKVDNKKYEQLGLDLF